MATVFEAQALTKCYRRRTVLDNLHLSIPQGSVYGLVGENGAGKTTLNCGNDKAVKLLAELDSGKGIGLIQRVKQGQGKGTAGQYPAPGAGHCRKAGIQYA